MAGSNMRGNEQRATEDQGAADPPLVGDASAGQQSLLDAIAAGNRRTALVLCTQLYGREIGRLCMAILGSQAEADDATQETLLAAHDSFEHYRGDGSVLAWLCGIARRRCARHLERTAKRTARLHLVAPPEHSPPEEELAARRQQAERARSALSALRPSDREALILRYVSGLSYRDIGVACQVEEATARQRVSRALSRIRDVLTKEAPRRD